MPVSHLRIRDRLQISVGEPLWINDASVHPSVSRPQRKSKGPRTPIQCLKWVSSPTLQGSKDDVGCLHSSQIPKKKKKKKTLKASKICSVVDLSWLSEKGNNGRLFKEIRRNFSCCKTELCSPLQTNSVLTFWKNWIHYQRQANHAGFSLSRWMHIVCHILLLCSTFRSAEQACVGARYVVSRWNSMLWNEIGISQEGVVTPLVFSKT